MATCGEFVGEDLVCSVGSGIFQYLRFDAQGPTVLHIYASSIVVEIDLLPSLSASGSALPTSALALGISRASLDIVDFELAPEGCLDPAGSGPGAWLDPGELCALDLALASPWGHLLVETVEEMIEVDLATKLAGALADEEMASRLHKFFNMPFGGMGIVLEWPMPVDASGALLDADLHGFLVEDQRLRAVYRMLP